MARVSRLLAAGAGAVEAVLADGYGYPRWVLGTQRIDFVDPGFPRVGTSLHFTAGVGPLNFSDRTTVRLREPGRLELEARGWPAGTARIGIAVLDEGPGRCRVTLDEHPLRGPAAWLHNPVLDQAVALRLRRMLRLLEQEARRRGSAVPAGTGGGGGPADPGNLADHGENGKAPG